MEISDSVVKESKQESSDGNRRDQIMKIHDSTMMKVTQSSSGDGEHGAGSGEADGSVSQGLEIIDSVVGEVHQTFNTNNKIELTMQLDQTESAIISQRAYQTMDGIRDLTTQLGTVLSVLGLGTPVDPGEHVTLGELDRGIVERVSQLLDSSMERSGTQTVPIESLQNVAWADFRSGNYAKSLDLFETVLQIADGDQGTIAAALRGLGQTKRRLGDSEGAFEALMSALNVYDELGDKAGVATARNNLGLIYFDKGDEDRALSYFDMSVAIYEAQGNQSGLATSLNNIGGVHYRAGDYEKALECFQRALEIKKANNFRPGFVNALNNLGSTHLAMGESERALESFNHALIYSKELSDRTSIATCETNIGQVYEKQGDLKKAFDQYWIGHDIRQELNLRADLADSLRRIGGIHLKRGDEERARRYGVQARAVEEGGE